MFDQRLKYVRSALYVPASNARALEKAVALDADMLILDLEDAVADQDKAAARQAAIAATQAGFGDKIVALRVNARDSIFHEDDMVAARQCSIDTIVVPKVDCLSHIEDVDSDLPLLAMIEGSAGLYAARDIAGSQRVAALIAGVNDIVFETGMRPGKNREGLELSLQMIVLAAAASGKAVLDGVFNNLDDGAQLDAECRQGRCYGFTGKTLIHPNQIAAANAIFGPSENDLAEAHALIAASKGGAQRFQGRMIENMHVEAARHILAYAQRVKGS